VAGDFRVIVTGGGLESARRLILATGLIDVLPPVPGLAERWGAGVVHCPYCHGWEHRDRPLAVLGLDGWGVHLAVHLRRFSDDVVLCINGALRLTADQADLLEARGVAVREQPLARLEGTGTSLERIVSDDGSACDRTALFCHASARQASDLPAALGCKILENGSVEVNDLGQTSVAGVFAAGDMARRASMPLPGGQVVIAAAEGTIAAVTIDRNCCMSLNRREVIVMTSPHPPVAGPGTSPQPRCRRSTAR
jgi:thioredoxin reductase